MTLLPPPPQPFPTSPTPTIKPLLYELDQQVTINFEEGLYPQALSHLTSLLTSGVPSHGTRHIPSASLLSLLATLSLHPNFTSRAKDASTARVSALSLRYLRLLNDLVDTRKSGITEALAWPEVSITRHGGLSRRNGNDEAGGGIGGDLTGIRSPYARDRSVFWKAGDFWAVVGWAMRCTLLHPARAKAYETWLEYMLETLERDFKVREDRDGGQAESLIAKYVKSARNRSRILRAVFADGSERYAGEFPEIWRHETMPARKGEKEETRRAKRVKVKVDMENDEFGDYLDPSTDDETESQAVYRSADEAEEPDPMNTDSVTRGGVATSQKGGSRLQQPENDDRTGILGGHMAAKQRMRLVGLLASLTHALPGHFGSSWTLYDDLLSYLKPLPIPTFLVLISPQYLSSFPPDAAFELVKPITNSLLQTGTKITKSVGLDQERLIESCLPYTANTNLYVDNAKLSICLETLMRMLDNHGMLYYDADLEMAVEKGIERREMKATTGRGKKGEANGEQGEVLDRQGLAASALRLRMLVHLKKVVAGKDAEPRF